MVASAQRIVDEFGGLFVSSHSALVFAFNFSSQQYDRPMMNRLAAPAIGTGKGLAGLDGAAQAGFIRAEVRDLGRLAEAILMARLAPRSNPCSCRAPCCRGNKDNKEWTNAISFLADYVRHTALAGCTAHGMMRREYVIRYFTPKEKRVSLDALAEKHSVDRHAASAHCGKVAALFGGTAARRDKPAAIGLETVAMNAIEDRLRLIGMVG